MGLKSADALKPWACLDWRVLCFWLVFQGTPKGKAFFFGLGGADV